MGTSEAAIEIADKKGVDTGFTADHPFLKGKRLPVYVANFVLMDYGSGAVFGCPAHDQRDLDFAHKYKLDVTPVVLPNGADLETFKIYKEAYGGNGSIINSDLLNGLEVDAAKSSHRTPTINKSWICGDKLSVARLGGVSATLLGLPDSCYSLRGLWLRSGARRRSACCIANRRHL